MRTFISVSQMKLSRLEAGQNCSTQGYYTPGDGGGALYLTAANAVVDGYGDHELANGTIAILQNAKAVLEAAQYGLVTDGVTDDSVALQACIDECALRGGGTVQLPYGTTVCNVLMKARVELRGKAYETMQASTDASITLKAAGTGAVVGGNGWDRSSVVGVGFKGLGDSVPLIGVHTAVGSQKRNIIRDCSFDNFADQAILLEGSGADIIENNLAQGCLLNRTRSNPSGVVEIADGVHDCYINGGEYTASSSLEGTISPGGDCGAVMLYGGTGFITNTVGEISDFGFKFTGDTWRVSGARADLNMGHGFIVDSGNLFGNCLALRNSQDTDNTYDGFLVGVGRSIFTGCKAQSLAADPNGHRYGFNDTQSATENKNVYAACEAVLSKTLDFKTSGTNGPKVSLGNAFHTMDTADATPDVNQKGFFTLSNAAPQDVTNFLNAFAGQEIIIRTFDTNTTFKNGTLRNPSGDIVSVVHGIYRYINIGGVWNYSGGWVAL